MSNTPQIDAFIKRMKTPLYAKTPLKFKYGRLMGRALRIERDNRRVCDNFTEAVASAMYFFERADKIDLSTCSYKEIVDMQDGWRDRYRSDARFHAKVQSIVSRLMHALDA